MGWIGRRASWWRAVTLLLQQGAEKESGLSPHENSLFTPVLFGKRRFWKFPQGDLDGKE